MRSCYTCAQPCEPDHSRCRACSPQDYGPVVKVVPLERVREMMEACWREAWMECEDVISATANTQEWRNIRWVESDAKSAIDALERDL